MFQLSFVLPVLWAVVLITTVTKKNSIQQPYFSILVAIICGTGAVIRISGYPEIGVVMEVIGLMLIAYRFYLYQKWKADRI